MPFVQVTWRLLYYEACGWVRGISLASFPFNAFPAGMLVALKFLSQRLQCFRRSHVFHLSSRSRIRALASQV